MKDYVRATLIVGSVIGLALALAVGCDRTDAAPAPFARTPRVAGKTPAPPCRCVMLFGGADYDATFAPDGTYRAACRNWDVVWVGTWKMLKTDGGHVLVIRERTANSANDWLVFHIPLDPCVRRGRADWEGRFRLEG